jgi:hypothetical protein
MTRLLKHSTGHVLNVLTEYAVDGRCTLSYEDISSICGYAPRTVQQAVQRLKESNRLKITRQPGDNRNSYVLLPA